MSNRKPSYYVKTPIESSSGTVIWQQVGAAWVQDEGAAKYALEVRLTALPLTAFGAPELKLYLFKPEDR